MIATLILSLCQMSSRAAGPPPGAPNNVLVIVLDDIGWSERALMPSLNFMSTNGVEFTRAYSFPTCSPTRLAATFGHLPRRDGIGDLSLNAHDPSQDRLPLDLFSVAELFAPTYRTALFGKWHLGRAPLDNGADFLGTPQLARVQAPIAPYAQGFEFGRAISPTTIAAGSGASGYYDWWRVDDGLMFMETRYAVNAERDEFLAWWATPSAQPKFGWLAFSAAHSPFDPPPGMSATGTVRGDYEQVVTHLDAQLATVLASVSLTDTFVVVFSDNGTPDDARPVGAASGVWKGSTFEGGIRVPFYVAGPDVKTGVSSSRLISVVDLPATLSDLAWIPIPGGMQDSLSFANGLGIWPGDPARSHVFVERYDVVAAAAYPQPAGFDSQVWIEGSLKRSITDEDGPGPLPATDLLYDLATDPNEISPVPFSGSDPSVVARFSSYQASLPPRL